MGTNFKSAYQKELRAIKSKIEDEVADSVRDVGIEIIFALLESKAVGGTPKLSGWLRANYMITLNTPQEGTVGSPKAVTTSMRDRLIRAFKSTKTNTILSANAIIINNDVPYGSYVNDGTATQPPQNFIEKSVQRGFKKLTRTRTIGK